MVMTTGEKIAVATGILGTVTGLVGLFWTMHKDNRELKMKEYKVYGVTGGSANPWFRGPGENVDMPQGGTDLGPVPAYKPVPFWKRTGRM